MIPNVFHFIYLTERPGLNPFGLSHYLAIKSAICVNRPDAVYFHCNDEPEGQWWNMTRPLVTIQKVTPPTAVHGKKVVHLAHKADVIRLQVLREYGGVYLDMDTICVRPLLEFYPLSFAMGQQFTVPHYYDVVKKVRACIGSLTLKPFLPSPIYGLCNGVIMSDPKHPFLDLWLDSYKTFRSTGKDAYWDEHSVRMPYEIARAHPGLLNVLSPYYFHYPLWDSVGLKMLFSQARSFPRAYVHHLWQSQSWDRYLAGLSPERVIAEDSTYNRIARQYIG